MMLNVYLELRTKFMLEILLADANYNLGFIEMSALVK